VQAFQKADFQPFTCKVGRLEGAGRRLQVRAESQQTAVAVLHHELARVPWHVGNAPKEFYALGSVLGIKRIGIFDEQVRVEQFVPVFVRIGCGRLERGVGAAECRPYTATFIQIWLPQRC